MPGERISQGNVLRMSPLAQAVASNKQQGVGSAQSGALGASTLPQSSGMVPADGSMSPPQLTEDELAMLEERAAAGDADALSLLEALGYVAGAGGVAAGGYALYKALQGRKPQAGPAEMNLGSGMPGSSSTAVDIPVTRVYEEVIPPPSQQIQPQTPLRQLPPPEQPKLPPQVNPQRIMRSLRR